MNKKLITPTIILFALLGIIGAFGYRLYGELAKNFSITNTTAPKVKANVPTPAIKIYQGKVIEVRTRSLNSGFLKILDSGNSYEINVDESEAKILDENNQATNLSYIKSGFTIKVTQATGISKNNNGILTASEIRVIEK